MANKVTTTDTTNKVVITPQSSKKLTIDSGDSNNITLNQSTPNNVQITNNDVDTSLTPNNVSISSTDNNVSLSSTSTPVTVNQSSTSIVTINTVGPQGPKGNDGADGDTLVSNDLEDLRLFTSSIQTEVDNLTAATSSYLTSVPDGTISSSAQITINESQISDLSHTDISPLNDFTSSIQTEVNNLTASTSSYALATNISGAFTEPSGGFSTRVTTLETNNTGTNTGDQDLSPYALITNISGAFTEPSGGFSTRVTILETAGYITESTDISALNIFTGSIQTEVDNLTAATSSYITESTDISALNTFTGSIQTEVDNLTAATSSYITESTDISALNIFTGSIQTEVDNLTAATSSYITESTDISALNTFTSSIQTEVNNLTAVTGSYALTSSISGAFAEPSGGFSTRITTLEGSNFTPSLSTDIEARNITASGNISSSGNITASNIQVANDIELLPQSKIFVGTSTTEIATNGDDYWIIKANGIRVADFKSNGVVFNESSSPVADFRIESDTKSHIFFVNSGENKISIGTDTVSDSILTVEGGISASGNLIGSEVTASGNVNIQGTLSLGDFTDVSASLAAAVAGGDNLGNHTATTNLNMDNNNIINVGNVDGVDVSILKSDFNIFTGSIQTEVDNLTAATSSYLTDPITTSSITDFNTEVSRSAAAAGFGTGGGDPTDISALNTFTGSIQTEVDNLTAVTGSYALTSSISGAFAEPSGGFSTRITTLETAGYITEATDISSLNTFTGSIQTEVDNLTAATSSYLTESTDISSLNIFTGSIQTEVDNLTAETSSYLTELPIGLISESAQFTTSDNFNVGDITSSALFINPTIGPAEIILDAGTSQYASQIKFSSFNSTPSWILGMDSVNPQDFRINKGNALNNAIGIYITGSTGYIGLGSLTPYERLTVAGNISASGIVYGSTGSFSHLEGNSPITVKDVITFQNKLTTTDLDITAASFKLGGGTFTSSSLAAAVGGGGDNLGNHTAELDLNMNTFDITNAGSITAVSLTGSISTSSIEDFDNSVNSLAQTVFDNRDLDSIDALNLFTGSIQIKVNNLTSVTSSYALTSSISGAFAEPSGGFSTRITTLETAGYLTDPITTSSITDFNTEVSRSAAAAGFGTGGEGGFTPSLSTDIEARNITASGDIKTNKIVNSGSTNSEITLNEANAAIGIKVNSTDAYRFFATSFRPNLAGVDLGKSNSIYRWDNFYVNYIDVNSNISASGDLIARSITGSISTSSIENFPTEVSRSAAAAGFGTGGEGTPTDISALNTFTGSIQTEIDNLTAVTGSYALTSSISGAFAEPSGGFSTRITTLETAGYLTSPITTSSITNFNTEVSRSAAAAGFGTGGGGGFTPSLSTNITALNITASANISASGNIIGNTGSFDHIEIDNFVNNGTGVPTISSATNLTLSASGAVVIKDLIQLNGTDTASISGPINGSIIYDSLQHKFFGYANGNWVAFN